MSRLIAFTLLAFAAFEWSLPFLDRAGLAALGFAFLALAVSPGGFRVARPARMNLPPKRVEVPDDAVDEALSVAQRIGAYDLP